MLLLGPADCREGFGVVVALVLLAQAGATTAQMARTVVMTVRVP